MPVVSSAGGGCVAPWVDVGGSAETVWIGVGGTIIADPPGLVTDVVGWAAPCGCDLGGCVSPAGNG